MHQLQKMKNILKKIWKWVRRDGLLHIETCLVIAIVLGWLLPWWWLGGIVAMAVGLGKEIWDKKHGVYDNHDLICDAIGAVLGMLILIVKIYL